VGGKKGKEEEPAREKGMDHSILNGSRRVRGKERKAESRWFRENQRDAKKKKAASFSASVKNKKAGGIPTTRNKRGAICNTEKQKVERKC